MPLLHHALRWLAPATLAAALLATPAHQAEAAIVTLDYTVSAPSFTNGAPPVLPASISFSATFDDSVVTTNSAIGLSINGANFLIGSTITFTYNPNNDAFLLGGGGNGVLGLVTGTDDFSIIILGTQSTPQLIGFELTMQGVQLGLSSVQPTLVVNTPAQDTPEPASLALFGVAMAALGTLRARRKHRQAA